MAKTASRRSDVYERVGPHAACTSEARMAVRTATDLCTAEEHGYATPDHGIVWRRKDGSGQKAPGTGDFMRRAPTAMWAALRGTQMPVRWTRTGMRDPSSLGDTKGVRRPHRLCVVAWALPMRDPAGFTRSCNRVRIRCTRRISARRPRATQLFPFFVSFLQTEDEKSFFHRSRDRGSHNKITSRHESLSNLYSRHTVREPI